MTSKILPQKDDTILIVGAGVFGLSTARELARRGYSNVTVLDRYPPPVPDGSSVDISRVIRPDYADDFYAKLGLEAMNGWTGEYQSFFHQSGLLCASQDPNHPYIEQSMKNLQRLGHKVTLFEGNDAKHRYSSIHGDLSNTRGYYNTVCGWADADGAIRYLGSQCAQSGVSFLSGGRGTVVSLIMDGRKISGVRTRSGDTVRGDHIILASGAWTPHLLDMKDVCVSNCQPVAFIQLTPEEAKEMDDCPVMIDLSTGWFAFPPTPRTNILKMARHGYGYEVLRESQTHSGKISVPNLLEDNALSTYLPEDAEKALRRGLGLFLPKFKDREFFRKRLCWYTDTRKGDFIVDYHSSYDNLFIATGGSGHAFKFLPVIGQYVVDAFQSNASEMQNSKWAWKPSSAPISKGDGSRGGPPRRPLNEQERAKL